MFTEGDAHEIDQKLRFGLTKSTVKEESIDKVVGKATDR